MKVIIKGMIKGIKDQVMSSQKLFPKPGVSINNLEISKRQVQKQQNVFNIPLIMKKTTKKTSKI